MDFSKKIFKISSFMAAILKQMNMHFLKTQNQMLLFKNVFKSLL